ncbi:MAG: hypothetical protein LQ351_007541 [Letrouitia transgressa]|nr:MAG: hypothetical protein LQ351_007541 [Letrouitia transgressa]
MDPASLVVAEQAVSTTVEGAAIAGVGLAQSTQPLSADFTQITSDAFLLRSSHTVAVVAGKAYIFGGKSKDGDLADTDVHIVRLPSTKAVNAGEPDYRCVPSLGGGDTPGTPRPRWGHAACAVGHRVYLFGGKGSQEVSEEKGRVWVFDTESLHWSYLDPPPEASYPPARTGHGCFASEHPLPHNEASEYASFAEQTKSALGKIPSLIGKSSPPKEPHGSLIICSGTELTIGNVLTDTWVFTIATQTWSPLPSTPPLSNQPSLAFANTTIYLIGGSSDVGDEIHHLQLQSTTYTDARGSGEVGLKAKPEQWQTLPFPTNPLVPGPRPRRGAGFLPVTTGNGRLYLLYFFGQKVSLSSGDEEPQYWSDTWSYQIPAADVTAASIKDKTRSLMGIATGEGTWSEVKVVANEERGLETEGKSHPGPRAWFGSAALGKDFDGSGVVLWGGINARGDTEGEGWIINVK